MITNGVLVATTGHSSTPLTRRGSPGSAPTVNGIPSTSSVAHTANTRDEVIGRPPQRSDSLFYTYFCSHQNYRQLACHAGRRWNGSVQHVTEERVENVFTTQRKTFHPCRKLFHFRKQAFLGALYSVQIDGVQPRSRGCCR